MTIRAKILRGFIIIVIIGALLGAIGVISSQLFTSRARDLEVMQKEADKFSEILNAHHSWRNNLTETVITGQEFKGALDPGACILGSWLSSEESKQVKDPQILALLGEIDGPHELIHHGAEPVLAMVEDGDMTGAQKELTTTILPKLDEVIAGLNAIGTRYNEMVSAEVVAVERLGAFFSILSISFVIVAVVVALCLAIVISGAISKPLSLLSSFMKKAGETGDLKLRPEDIASIERLSQSKDEIGQAISGSASFVHRVTNISEKLKSMAGGDLTVDVNVLSESDVLGISLRDMGNNLSNMFGAIRSTSDMVSSGSRQVADGAQALAQGATEQAATIQELSASITEIAEKTKENADIADKTSKLSTKIKESAEKGSRQMDDMIAAVDEINDASMNINKIIKTIDDIAFQTNILALNAAVEAARAGQHGKGFAVVAEEVRNLASKSAEAARDTGDMIQNSMEKAELGSRIAGETAASLKEIVAGINDSSLLISEIAGASEEQFQNISRVNNGIDQVTLVVQQNSATAEESASASEEMSNQSNTLHDLISQFNLRESDAVYQDLPRIAPTEQEDTAPSATPQMTTTFSFEHGNEDLGKYGDDSSPGWRGRVRGAANA